jgi:hypothetical protein
MKWDCAIYWFNLAKRQSNDAVIERAIEIRRSVRIKIPDALVAATALIYEANLVTRNTGDFKNVPDLSVLGPAM